MKRRGYLRKVLAMGMTAGMLITGSLGNSTGSVAVQAAITDGKVLVDGLDRSPDYYILPDSSDTELSADTVAGLSDSQRQMAINEIYARHGRKFVIPEVQDYFNEKAWYLGTVAADSFDENVFSSIEETNIGKLVSAMDNGKDAGGARNTNSEIYTDFSGEYHLYAQSKEVIVQLTVYADQSPAEASEGTECGTVEVSCRYMDGGMSYMNGYFSKKSGNNYVLAGRGMNGITVTVGQDNITVGHSKSINGIYEKE